MKQVFLFPVARPGTGKREVSFDDIADDIFCGIMVRDADREYLTRFFSAEGLRARPTRPYDVMFADDVVLNHTA